MKSLMILIVALVLIAGPTLFNSSALYAADKDRSTEVCGGHSPTYVSDNDRSYTPNCQMDMYIK